ncbi:MAG TPA: TetR/AcrR family transcriptional regulator [Phenylobacterium sp.]|nr:TetR/AcrR family transcriptional regulator [Phenylobacterium sp.]
MSQVPPQKSAPASSDIADGRRRRGQDNRARIVKAMLEIIQSGEVAPSAEQVAVRADVGLRTVFRHFQDMDSLYREMSVAIEAELRMAVDRPFLSPDWRGRLSELIQRRAVAFEKIAPFKRASDVFRYRSKFLEADTARPVATLREILKRHLPPEIIADSVKLEALDLLLSFESWSRLRREQSLSAARTREILEAAVGRIID